MKKKRLEYSPSLPRQMYIYFIDYEDRGAPSFHKFARSMGATVEDIERLRSNKRFDRAYKECLQIRRDYLIDRALDRRFDPSFVKHLLCSEEVGSDEEARDLVVKLEVTE